MFVGGVAVGVGIARITDDVTEAVIGVAVVVRTRASRSEGGAVRIAGERIGQAIQPVVLETLLIGDIATVIIAVS